MSDTLAIARQLAAAHPQVMLPCPVCAASLKASNLDRHLSEVHRLNAGPTKAGGRALVLSGADRRVFWVLLIPASLLLAGAVALALVQSSAGVKLGDGAATVPVALLTAALALPVVAVLRPFRAQLVLGAQSVELRYAFGCLSLQVALPSTVESGSLWGTRQAAGMHQYEHSVPEDIRVGSYLRLCSAHTTVTIGTKGSSLLRKHWRGAQSGPRRHRWDITLDRIASVELQYHLAAHHLLAPLNQPN